MSSVAEHEHLQSAFIDAVGCSVAINAAVPRSFWIIARDIVKDGREDDVAYLMQFGELRQQLGEELLTGSLLFFGCPLN